MTLLDYQGNRLLLGDKIGEGGEGAVYRLAERPSHVAKIYKGVMKPPLVDKITTLARIGQGASDLPVVWPSGLVTDEARRPLGLLMPLVDGGTDVHNLHTPVSRRRHFPRADWRFLVHVSANVARAVDRIHALGLVIGDINDGSILVLPSGTVRLIDVDSFQVPVSGRAPLLCTVANDLFLPPELAGADLHSVVRTPQHDAFGLAVIVFKLLMLGRHPFAGRYLGPEEMPINRAVREHRFAYGKDAARQRMQPPPRALQLSALPPQIAGLVEAAFAPPSATRLRPTAQAWVHALGEMAAGMVSCGRNATHMYARESARCPWCELERGGVIVFGALTDPGSDAEMQALLRRFALVPAQSPAVVTQVIEHPSADPAAVVVGPRLKWWLKASIIAALVLIAVVVPVVGLLVAIGVGLPLLVIAIRSRRRRRPWIVRHQAAKRAVDSATADLTRANGFPRTVAARAAADHAERQWHDLPNRRAEKIRLLREEQRRHQLQGHLQGAAINSAYIPQIGPERKATLAVYGIHTAADIDAARIREIHGFGEALVSTLTWWRDSIVSSCVYRPNSPLQPQAATRLSAEMAHLQRTVIQEFRRALADLGAAHVHEQAAVDDAARTLLAARKDLAQAEADRCAATGKRRGS